MRPGPEGAEEKRRATTIAPQRKASAAPTSASPATQEASNFARKLLDTVRSILDDDQADDVVVIELSGKSTIADYMVIASGRSQRHVGAMAEHIQQGLKRAGVERVPAEGAARADWVLIDGGDVIVHLFRPEVRAFYGLEKMWGVNMSRAARATQANATA